MDIAGKAIVVTGGASGLGKTITEALLEAGASVAVYDCDDKALASLEGRLSLLKINCDVTDYDEVKAALKTTVEQFGRIDVLVNNAGVLHSEPLISIVGESKRHSLESWRRVIDVNLTAPLLVSSFVAEHMVMNRVSGLIVNISSISAKGNSGQTAYSAAKAGLESMTKVWAKELGSSGVRCVAISPGFMDTSSTQAAIGEAMMMEMQKKTPLRRLGSPHEIAKTVKFVIENDYVNGDTISVNGGLSL